MTKNINELSANLLKRYKAKSQAQMADTAADAEKKRATATKKTAGRGYDFGNEWPRKKRYTEKDKDALQIARSAEGKARHVKDKRNPGITKANMRIAYKTNEDIEMLRIIKEDPDTTFGKNKPRLDGLPNNDWHGQGDVSYSNETNVVPGSEVKADLNGRNDAQPKGFEGEKMGRTRPKMDAIPDDGKWDPNYLESVTSAVLSGDHVALAEAFNSAIRAKIDAILFGEEEGDGVEDTASEEGDDGVSIPNDTGVGPADTESKSSIKKMRDAMKLKGRNLSPQEKMDVNFKTVPDSIMKNPSGLSG